MLSTVAFIPLSPLEFFPFGVMVIFLVLVQGLELPISQSDSLHNIAELAVWESLGIADVDFDTADSFVTSLGIGKPPDYDNGLKFVLFNRENRQNGTVITSDPNELKKILNPDVKTKIFIHGYRNDLNSEASVIIRNAYLDYDDFNMIMVDWGPLAVAPNYVAARSHAIEVARRTGILLNALADSNICAPKDQHIIGHSLGGQIAGLAAGQARTKPGRCTGLDPAGPLFQVSTARGRIDPTDAYLVDIIHTTAALWGFPGPLGHVDFYPNGGVWPQPGCPLDIDDVSSLADRYTHSQGKVVIHGPLKENYRDFIERGAAYLKYGGDKNNIFYETFLNCYRTPGLYYLEATLPL